VAGPFVDPPEVDPFAGSVPFAMNVSQIYEAEGEPVEMRSIWRGRAKLPTEVPRGKAGLLARAARTAGAISSAAASLTTGAQPRAIPCGTLQFELVRTTFSQLRVLLVELTMQGLQSL
jgi:hypothetical protein